MQFPPFRIACYRFTLEAVDPLQLPVYKGSTLRGSFGYAFKKMVCSQSDWRACTPCQRGNECPYGYIFESSVPKDSQVLRNLREIPLPFIIEPPESEQTAYQPGELLDFELILIGKAINYLPYFLLAFQEVGRTGLGKGRGRAVLKRILSEHPWLRTSQIVYDGVDVHVGGRDLSLNNKDVQEQAAKLPKEQITLDFRTPTRLKHQEQLVAQPEFHVLIRALMRRFSSLSYFHGQQRWETDYRGSIEAAREIAIQGSELAWANWERYSGRQEKLINLGGFVGKIAYRGEINEYLSLLALGEMIHVGKATVFGNGKYRLLDLH